MDQKEIINNFIDSFKSRPAIIDFDLLKTFITDIIVDSQSLEDFILRTDRYFKHSHTFQMGFLLHSLASVLNFSPLGNPIDQVVALLPTDAFHIDSPDLDELSKTEAGSRYDQLCQKLMNCDEHEAQSLNKRTDEGRKLEKLDDGGTMKNPMFDPMATKFRDETEPGYDLTEELEAE